MDEATINFGYPKHLSEVLPKILPKILADTPSWLVVDKPAGWLTIPGRETFTHSQMGKGSPILLNWLREKFGDVWTVHRLDRETSGIVLFARTREDHRKASTWFQKREIRKVYDCIASGRASVPVIRINDPIGDQACVTQLEVKDAYHEGFIGKVFPLTGRRHQIRIHLSRRGFPIWGDREYGGPTQLILKGSVLKVDRVALHASRITLPDGSFFSSEWPADFKSWAERLQSDGYRS